MKTHILITVKHGMIQHVESTEDIQVTILDFDNAYPLMGTSSPDNIIDHQTIDNTIRAIAEKRLEELREELRMERISYEEIAELQGLSKYINEGDVELLEAAGVPEHEDLLEDFDNLPENVKQILNSFDEDQDGYFECNRIVKELKTVGYTAEYGLSAELYNLRKL